jgi:hypothetical protein
LGVVAVQRLLERKSASILKYRNKILVLSSSRATPFMLSHHDSLPLFRRTVSQPSEPHMSPLRGH